MNHRLFSLLLLLICLSGYALAEAPVIHSVTASALTTQSGQPVNFTVIATDADDDIASYNWDFDDGETSTEQAPSHFFVLPTGQSVDTFTVTLTVIDAEGGQASDSVNVRVNKSFVSMEVIAPQSGQSFSKGEPVHLELMLRDNQGQPLGAYLAYYVRAEVEGVVTELVSAEEFGVFEAEWQPGFKVSNNVDIEFTASALVEKEPRFASQTLAVSFVPVELSADLAFMPAGLTDGQKLESIELFLSYPDGSLVKEATITTTLNGEPIVFASTIDRYVADTSLTVSRAAPPVLVLQAHDDFGNASADLRETVRVAAFIPGVTPEPDVPIGDITAPDDVFASFGEDIEGTVALLAIAVVAVIVLIVLFIVLGMVLRREGERPKQVAEFVPVEELRAGPVPERIKVLAKKKPLTLETADETIARIKKTVKPVKKMTAADRLQALTDKVETMTLKEKVALKTLDEFESLPRSDKKKVKDMVALLEPYKEKYTFQEIENAAMTEGYNSKLAGIIARKLKGKK